MTDLSQQISLLLQWSREEHLTIMIDELLDIISQYPSAAATTAVVDAVMATTTTVEDDDFESCQAEIIDYIRKEMIIQEDVVRERELEIEIEIELQEAAGGGGDESLSQTAEFLCLERNHHEFIKHQCAAVKVCILRHLSLHRNCCFRQGSSTCSQDGGSGGGDGGGSIYAILHYKLWDLFWRYVPLKKEIARAGIIWMLEQGKTIAASASASASISSQRQVAAIDSDVHFLIHVSCASLSPFQATSIPQDHLKDTGWIQQASSILATHPPLNHRHPQFQKQWLHIQMKWEQLKSALVYRRGLGIR